MSLIINGAEMLFKRVYMHDLLPKREYKIITASNRQIGLAFVRKTFAISPWRLFWLPYYSNGTLACLQY
ncbi:protein of unknown function [Shewanella benthica]|uniref:Uncharacterized protein n=1 Tax=Shewanella benthica TaxID=43661 RepID=A0A330M6F6_9GAMM|nr:protein of unknown function [Shewanella benthica]